MSWKLVTACSLQEQLGDWAHGFLVAAVNVVNKTITVLACVPSTDTDHQQIAGASCVGQPHHQAGSC